MHFISYARYLDICFSRQYHHLDEFVVVNLSVAVDIGLPDHLVHLLVGELLAEVGHDVAQLSRGDEAVAVLVKDLEGLLDLLLRVGVLHLAGHHGQELGEVDGAVAVGVDLVNHVLQLALGGVLAKRAHDGAQLLGGDGAVAVLVEQREGLLELGDLLLGQLVRLRQTRVPLGKPWLAFSPRQTTQFSSLDGLVHRDLWYPLKPVGKGHVGRRAQFTGVVQHRYPFAPTRIAGICRNSGIIAFDGPVAAKCKGRAC